MLEKSENSRVLDALRRWLDLEDEHAQLKQQAVHIRSTLDDQILSRLLEDRASDVAQTVIRLGRELTRLQSVQPADVGAKVYVLQQIIPLCDDETVCTGICQIIRADIERLDIKIERFSDERQKAG
ncbi:hypothetical protein D1227_19340 [Henriciella mobilis]|uniref:hypothetical protein n=1 Tax=Henriciella mobilis TaxID=2305467 RepID=UPI000E67071A|nr:hypothetical protein [Henriciella mobilis]RIJ15647.1 hypothetical protein D1231_12990 [Henriciella mobilis]RIJ19111.1 hypothetical protein D1227_19340 [Henriciella mobilis]